MPSELRQIGLIADHPDPPVETEGLQIALLRCFPVVDAVVDVAEIHEGVTQEVWIVGCPLQLDQTKVHDQGLVESAETSQRRAHRQPARFQLLVVTDPPIVTSVNLKEF